MVTVYAWQAELIEREKRKFPTDQAYREHCDRRYREIVATWEQEHAVKLEESWKLDIPEKQWFNRPLALKTIWERIQDDCDDWDRDPAKGEPYRPNFTLPTEETENRPTNADVRPEAENARVEGAHDPVDLFGTLTPEPVLSPDMLPKAIRDFAWDTADRMGITPATVAMASLAVSAAAIDDQIVIQHTDDWTWTESARLWCKAVGDPGVTHTAALNAAAAPLEHIEREWREQDDEARTAYSRQMGAYKVALKSWENQKASALNGKGDDPGEPPVEPEEPALRRLVATDYTMESLQEILLDNPRGILLKIDELAAFTGSFDAYRGKSGKDRPNALKLWDGGSLPVDRVGRHGNIRNWSACIVGKVQENKLASMAPGLTDDGLMQRFLVYEIGTVSMGSHRQPDREAISQYEQMIRFLVNQTYNGEPITLSGAAEPYRERIERITYALKSLPVLSPAFRAHAAKLHGQFARLVLVMHLVDYHEQHGYMLADDRMIVSGETAKRVHDLMMQFLIPNAIRIYSRYFDEYDASGSDVRWIADHILAHHSERLTARDLYRAKPEFDKHRKRLERAVDGLVDANWLTVVPGRQVNSITYVVNPIVHTKYAERAEQERERRAAIREKIANQSKVVVDAY
jgi:hypothetical protein